GPPAYTLACGFPDRHWAIDRAAYRLDARVDVVPFAEKDVLALISKAYHADAQEVAEVADELAAQDPATGEWRLSEDVLELDDKAPAVKLVHSMLLQAVKQRASDIHIEPREDGI